MKKLYLLTIELDTGNVLRKIYRKGSLKEIDEDLTRLMKRHKGHILGFYLRELKTRKK